MDGGWGVVAIAFVSLQDSGWREIDEQRVAELEAAFKQGDFGQTTLSMPTVVGDVGESPWSQLWTDAFA